MSHFSLSEIPVAILAGGLGTRLRPLTEHVPKVLVPVAGRPFLSHQLELLRRQGIRRVVGCLGYLGEKVVEEFGDGQAWGVQLEYSFDGPTLLGTGGALRRALPKLGDEFFVLYGDSFLTTPFLPVARFFERSGKSGLMTVYRNEGLHETSNVVFRNGQIVLYSKKARLPEMRHIDYGLSLFRASVFKEWPEGQPFDLGEVTQRLVARGDLAGFEVPERFYEIGSTAGLMELETIFRKAQSEKIGN
jgi:NDP-sugar pyrophosphorylase family protein